MSNNIKIKYGKLGFLLYVNGIKVNFGSTEFINITSLRKYWNYNRVLLLAGYRHETLKDYMTSNINAGN